MRRDDYDRVSTNESDGRTFYGLDTEDGKTVWYDSEGNADSITETPYDD